MVRKKEVWAQDFPYLRGSNFHQNALGFVFYIPHHMWEAASLSAAGGVGFFPWAEQEMENGLFCGGVYGVPLVNEPESLRWESPWEETRQPC